MSRWSSFKESVFNQTMVVTFFMGFSGGLPFLLKGQTLSAWLTDLNVDRSSIGLFAIVGLPYTLKFLWAPLMDRYAPFQFLGRRRSWLVLSQLGVIFTLVLLSFSDPQNHLVTVAFFAFLVSFFGASQDIVIDAYRRETLTDQQLGLGSSLYMNGYRAANYFSSAIALLIAGAVSWKAAYLVMAGTMLICLLISLKTKEPLVHSQPTTLREAVVEPFVEYFKRKGAFTILAFILFYKLGDAMASQMTTNFLLSKTVGLGFSKAEYVGIVKTFGLVGLFGGALIGGSVMVKIGINKALWIFGFLQMISTAGFSLLAEVGKSLPLLTGVITFEFSAMGMGSAAFMAFMASLTNKKFTATQYALLTSLMGVPQVIFSAPTGYLAEQLGWTQFYLFCTFIALIGIFLLFKVAPWGENPTLSKS
ncbi:MAG: AmpG family muropeptide MFS transporter [Bdellovibrionaceae bacterium]|nr:AmpG family muropeptide MFS transporter [Pseudobdellovibrionaceae bacterium]